MISESYPKPGIILICTKSKLRAVKVHEGTRGEIIEIKSWTENIHDSKLYLCLGVSETSLKETVQTLALSGVKPLTLKKVKCIWEEEKLCKP